MVFFKNPNRTTVVISTVSSWDESPRIRHQIAELLREDFNILFLELPFSARISKKNALRKVYDDMFVLSTGGLPRGLNRLRLSSPVLHNLIDRAIAYKIRKLLRKLFLQHNHELVLFNFQYDFPRVSEICNWSKSIYLCNDDFTDRAESERKRAILSGFERKVCEQMDVCLGVSDYLVSKLLKYNINSHLFLPGHFFDIELSKEHKKINKSSSIINVAYMGYINQRLRFDWLHTLALDKNIRIHLIGPVEYIDSKLLDLGTIEFLGNKIGLDLQKCLLEMDILIMPYVEREALATQAPNKLFQYIAVGKPIVTTPMPNLIKLPEGFVYTAHSPKEFVDIIKLAHAQDNPNLCLKRLYYSQNTCWSAKKNFLLELIVQS